MTLGIPTQSDVKDAKYKKVLKQESIKNKISYFPSSNIDIKNAISSHYNGKKVYAKKVLNSCLEKIQNFQTNLFNGINEKVTSMSYKFNSSTHPNEYGGIILQAPNERYKILINSSNIKIKERSSIMQKLLDKPKYKISFSPYKTAMTESSTLRTQLKNSQKGRNTLDDLLSMEKIIENFEDNNANTAILKHKLVNRFKTLDEFESNTKSTAYDIKKQHEKVAEESNIYLSFNEMYWMVNLRDGVNGFPIKENHVLNDKSKLKPLIEKELDKTGTVIFNGEIFDSWKGIVEYYSSEDFLNPFAGNCWNYG